MTQLAAYSNLALYSTLVVLGIALVAYAIDLAHARQWAPAADAVREPALVGAGAADTPAAPASSTPVGHGLRHESRDTTGDSAHNPLPSEGGAASERVKRPAAGIGFMLTLLAELLLVAAIVLRAASVKRPPLGNMYEFSMVGSAFMLGAFLIWAARKDVRWLGLFVTGPVLITLGVAVGRFYTEALQLMPALRSVWLVIHVTIATLSTALFGIGAILTVLYLVRLRYEEKDIPAPGWLAGIPRAATLDRYAYGLHIIAFPLWTFTVIAGAIWAEQAWGRYWGWDPKEVWSFVIWVVYAAYLHARATSGWDARRAAWLALAGMLCLILNFAVVNVFFVGKHSYSGM